MLVCNTEHILTHESTLQLCTDGRCLSLIKNTLLLSSLTRIICLLPTKKASLSVSLYVSPHRERNQIDQSSNLFCISLAQYTSKMTTLKAVCIALCQRSA